MEPLISITAFLQFLEDPPVERVERAMALEKHLDRLAWIRHDLGSGFDERELPDPPGTDYATGRSALAARFPDLGWYHALSSVYGEAAAEVLAGDALDDLTDIQADLKAFLWRWEHNSQNDALFHLRTLLPHWMGHVRGLQSYLSDWLW